MRIYRCYFNYNLYQNFLVFSANASLSLHKQFKLEAEINTHGRPVSVVAPTNSVMKKNSQEFNRDQPLFVSPVTSRPPEIKHMSSLACNQQQQQRISIQEINKQLNNIDIQEPTSVSVSKWLQTLPNNLDSSSSNPTINSSIKKNDSSPENIMYDQNKPIIKEIVLVNHEIHIFNHNVR